MHKNVSNKTFLCTIVISVSLPLLVSHTFIFGLLIYYFFFYFLKKLTIIYYLVLTIFFIQ